ncbi:hypothetical protein yberc0001_18040 [Yersinia bercovieri ATCC 43970]|uniref:Uncharacterized protein n=1 Tax=Yersinia bercovieri ATCC 43970 TaxID=349968 RepID=A0ABP2E1K2_YERBE|nr:hypothetical protein yberc0001_18040 [Yersinia bercovieri ATCC 43970]
MLIDAHFNKCFIASGETSHLMVIKDHADLSPNQANLV